MRENTIKVYDGPSLLDGERIIVLASGFTKGSSNTKTGHMIQTWILRYDTAPHDAQKNGADASVCGACPLRPLLYKAAAQDKPCYVTTFRAPLSTWKAHKDKPVTPAEDVKRLVAGKKVRRGSYGDPAAVPLWVWELLDGDRNATGYTHQWRSNAKLAAFTMASVHSVAEARLAQAFGFRTFRVLSKNESPEHDEVLCPASKEAGNRTTCASCGLCSGAKPNDPRKNVAIYAH